MDLNFYIQPHHATFLRTTAHPPFLLSAIVQALPSIPSRTPRCICCSDKIYVALTKSPRKYYVYIVFQLWISIVYLYPSANSAPTVPSLCISSSNAFHPLENTTVSDASTSVPRGSEHELYEDAVASLQSVSATLRVSFNDLSESSSGACVEQGDEELLDVETVRRWLYRKTSPACCIFAWQVAEQLCADGI